MLAQRAIWICVGLAGILMGMARGDHRHHCDCLVRLSGELRMHGRELGEEFRDTYRSTPQFGAMMAHSREIISRAGRLQALARAGKNYHEMHSEAQCLSRTHRVLVDTVRKADASLGVGYPGPAWRYGNVSSKNREVQRLLACAQTTIHEIHEEIHKLPSVPDRPVRDRDYAQHHHPRGGHGGLWFREPDPQPPVERAPFHPGPTGFRFGPPPQPGQPGLTISNGRFTFQLSR